MNALLLLACLAILLAFAGAIYQATGTRSDERRFLPPGRFVTAGGSRIHAQEAGAGAPAVLLEAGIAATSLSWTPVFRGIAQFTRVLSYDRPGLGWSDSPRKPRTIENFVQDLRELLSAAQTGQKPVLAGHSFGGLIVLFYASRYPEDVGGLLLVDPVAPAEWANASARDLAMLRRGVRLSRRGALLARLGIVRFSLALLMAGSRLLPRFVGRIASGRGAGVMERLTGEVRKLPEEVWPMVRSHWCRPRCFHAMASYLEALPSSAAAVAACFVPSHIPITILSASDSQPERLREHQAIAQRSERGRHLIAGKSGHWVLLDEPELVIDAVRDLVDYCRTQ